MNLKDRLEIFRKNNRTISPKPVILICSLLLAGLVGGNFYRTNFKIFDTSFQSSQQKNESQITFLGDLILT